MYLPRHQYSIKTLAEIGNIDSLTDLAGKLIDIPGKNIILTSFGQLFDRRTVDVERGDFTKAVKLFPTPSVEEVESQNNPGYEYLATDSKSPTSLGRLSPHKIPPTSKERQNGIMTRCFYKNMSTGKVKEILKTQADKFLIQGQRFEKVLCVDWEIKGPGKDQTVNGYFLEGVETRNQRTLEQLKQTLPGVEQLIEGPGEYLQDILIQESTPLLPRDNSIVIPAPGKRL